MEEGERESSRSIQNPTRIWTQPGEMENDDDDDETGCGPNGQQQRALTNKQIKRERERERERTKERENVILTHSLTFRSFRIEAFSYDM